MPVNRGVWEDSLKKDWVPAWPCPQCKNATLKIIKSTLSTAEDANFIEYRREDPDFEPENETGCFVCLLRCARSECGEVCAVSGKYDIDLEYSIHGHFTYSRHIPKSITLPPPMIEIPKATPDGVRAEVVGAFTLYWSDLAACLNRIRNALELVLDDLKIAKTTINKKKKRVRLYLHQRIEKLEKKRPAWKEHCRQMMAVKHLGNAGSHPGVVVKAEDVFDGFDILERVLHDRYSELPGQLAKMVKQIIKRKGPRKKVH